MHPLAKQAIEAILDFSEVRMKAGEQAIWPALWGHTGSGKTTIARQVAKEQGMECITILLHSMQPEDVLGLPELGRGPVKWRESEWIVTASLKPTLILLDEIDKARPEVIATVLTALASHEVRGTKLHPETSFILAGQPVPPEQFLADATGEALSARVSWIQIPYNWDSLSQHLSVNLKWLPVQEIPPLPILPRPSPRHISWAVSWIRQIRPAKELQSAVLSGMFPKEAVEKIIESANEINTELLAGIDLADALLSNLQELITKYVGAEKKDSKKYHSLMDKARSESIAGKLPLPALGKAMPDIWHHGTIELLVLTIKRLWTEGDPEMVYNTMKTALEELSNRANASSGEINVLGDATEDQVLEALEGIAVEIANVYIARNEKTSKSKEKGDKK